MNTIFDRAKNVLSNSNCESTGIVRSKLTLTKSIKALTLVAGVGCFVIGSGELIANHVNNSNSQYNQMAEKEIRNTAQNDLLLDYQMISKYVYKVSTEFNENVKEGNFDSDQASYLADLINRQIEKLDKVEQTGIGKVWHQNLEEDRSRINKQLNIVQSHQYQPQSTIK